MKYCKCPGCTKAAKVAGQCWGHYNKMRNYGTWVPTDVCVCCGDEFATVKKGSLYCPGCKDDAYDNYRKQWREDNADVLRERKQRYYTENSETIKARVRKWGSENRDKKRKYNLAWRENNRDKARSSSLKWARANKQHQSEYSRKRRKENPDRYRQAVRRRRARLHGASRFRVTDRDIVRLLNRFYYCCAYCGRDISNGFHIDHVVPLARGGSDGIGNYLPACPFCNESKGAKTLVEWRVWKSKMGV